MLEQALSFKNGKGTSAQPPMKTSSIHVPRAFQNLGKDLINGNHFIHLSPIYPSQAQITMSPTTKPSDIGLLIPQAMINGLP